MINRHSGNQSGLGSEHDGTPRTPTVPDDKDILVLSFEMVGNGLDLRESFLFIVVFREFWKVDVFEFFGSKVNESRFIEHVRNIDCNGDFLGKSIGEETMVVVFVAENVGEVDQAVLLVLSSDIDFTIADGGFVADGSSGVDMAKDAVFMSRHCGRWRQEIRKQLNNSVRGSRAKYLCLKSQGV